MVSKNEAVRLAESFRLFCAQQEVVLRRQRVNVFVSIGVANIPEDAANPEDLLRLADQALLNAKKKGRNRVCFF
jgi:diguanylate cyclase (GGDEF)-like protein